MPRPQTGFEEEEHQMEPHEVLESLGRTIRRSRESMGLTRAQYATRCGLSASTIKKVEGGDDLRIETLVRMAAGLEMSLIELIDEADPVGGSMRHELRQLSSRVGMLDQDEQGLVSALVKVLEKQAGPRSSRPAPTEPDASPPPG